MSIEVTQVDGMPYYRAATIFAADSSIQNSLEGIDANFLVDGTVCWVADGSDEYRWYADSVAAPSNPTVILPANWDLSDPGRWLLVVPPVGSTGATGPQGVTGATGAGATGATGPQGATGSGGSMPILTRTVWVDVGTTVAPGDQTGTIAAPFDNLQDAVDYLAPLGGGVMLIVPGSYAGPAITTGDRYSFVGQTAASQANDVVIAGIDSSGAGVPPEIFLSNIYLNTYVGQTLNAPGSVLRMQDCGALGEITGRILICHNCNFNNTITLSDQAEFRDCQTPTINAGNSVSMYDCIVAGSITVPGADVVFLDTVSNYWLIFNAASVIGGTKELMYDITP